jgi:F-type H+-transporting ATPase subunit epsilon
MPLRLSVVTPARPFVEADVDSVVAPGTLGQFGVLPGHERFLAPLSEGVLEYTQSGRTTRLRIGGGFAEVQPDRMTVLADTAESLT